ncbi:hypothetical protein HPP92_015096 [Vanilla planifolia]|uniref:NAC domain-containing protein n=1 Tax=Vanilla planifolia TaxID=51239 RepID=A0A835QS95_VANPL|nr:hypothetical protein HPP92_015096 [Vanilla planifolia]
MVLLQPKGSKVPQRSPTEPVGRVRVLEGHRNGQGDRGEPTEGEHWSQKDFGVLQGKPNNGVKTSWIMHEYRLNDQYLSCGHQPLVKQQEDSMRLDDWVLCRIYQKNRGQALVDEEQGNSAFEETEKQNSAYFSLSEMLTEDADYCSVSRMFETQMSSTISDRASFSNPELIHPLEQKYQR